MARYLLFLDTETTGMPTRWDQPYEDERAWPSVAQLAWAVHTTEGTVVKTDQAYLQIPAGRMPASAVAIHGLTPEFLQAHGQQPASVLRRLLADLATYQPRVVGHFLRFDFHVLGAAFQRAGLPNPLPGLPQFCTMAPAWPPLAATAPRRLRLHELHEMLVREPLPRLHDAVVDAAATARCYFELQRRGLLSDALLAAHTPLTAMPARAARGKWLLPLLVIGILACYVLYRLVYA